MPCLSADLFVVQAVIPFIPTDAPRLDPVVYGMILGYFLSHDRQALVHTIQTWPRDIYDIPAVIVAVQADLDRAAYSAPSGTDTRLLMEALGELYVVLSSSDRLMLIFPADM